MQLASNPDNQNMTARNSEILYWLDILLHSTSEPMNDLFTELDRLGVVFGDGSYVVVQFALDAEYVLHRGDSRGVYLDKLYSLVQSRLGHERIVYTVLCSGHVISVIYYPRANKETFDNADAVLEGIARDCGEICGSFYEEHEVLLFSVVSKLYVRAVNIALAYWNSCDMLDYCYFAKHHEVVCEAFYEEHRTPFSDTMELDEAFAAELLNLALSKAPPEACAEKMMEYLRQQCFPFLGYFRQRLQNICGILWHQLRQLRHGDKAIVSQLVFDPYFNSHSVTWRFMTNALTEQFENFNQIEPFHNENTRKAQKIIEYINSHYTDSALSVGGIARYFMVSQSHLSSQFKHAMGVNLSEYIHTVRISEAKERIKNSDASMFQIAEAVGYTNTSTFYRVFKKLEGVSPNQFRSNDDL